MFPSHFSVTDFGVFAVVLVFGLIVILLFMLDFVSIFLQIILGEGAREMSLELNIVPNIELDSALKVV